MAGKIDTLSSPIQSLDEDYTMTDRMLNEMLGLDSDIQSDAMTLRDPTEIGDSEFLGTAHGGHTLTDNALSPFPNSMTLNLYTKGLIGMLSDANPMSPPQVRSDFNLDAYLASSPLTSVQHSLDTGCSGPTTPWQISGLSPLSIGQETAQDTVDKRSITTAPPAVSPARCQCLLTVGALLEGFERKKHFRDPAALDSILASHKEALTRCNVILSCSACTARSEHMLLLGMITERLVALYESTVSLYLEQVQRHHSFGVSSNGMPQPRGPLDESNKIFLGHYEVDSPEEWSSLIQVLLVLQLRGLWGLLEGMKKAVAGGKSATQLPMVDTCERRVARLVQKLRLPVIQRQ